MTYLGGRREQISMVQIERQIVDYFEAAGADVEHADAEWFVYVDDREGKVSLTGLAAAISTALTTPPAP